MKEILTYVMLDGKKEEEEKFFDGTVNADIEGLISKGREVSNDTIFETFFEEPHEDMIISVKVGKREQKIEMDIHLRDAFYYKHIGKYMDAEEILLRLMMTLEKNLDDVCWKSAAGHGCGGGCHG